MESPKMLEYLELDGLQIQEPPNLKVFKENQDAVLELHAVECAEPRKLNTNNPVTKERDLNSKESKENQDAVEVSHVAECAVETLELEDQNILQSMVIRDQDLKELLESQAAVALA